MSFSTATEALFTPSSPVHSDASPLNAQQQYFPSKNAAAFASEGCFSPSSAVHRATAQQEQEEESTGVCVGGVCKEGGVSRTRSSTSTTAADLLPLGEGRGCRGMSGFSEEESIDEEDAKMTEEEEGESEDEEEVTCGDADMPDSPTETQDETQETHEEKEETQEGDAVSETQQTFSKEQTLMIFDWDDTLLPSTWLAMHGLRLDDECVVSPQQKELLSTMADSARRTLELACSLGTVIIVTNAEHGWIDLSCKKFMPSLHPFLMLQSEIRIVSARSTFEPLGISSPFEWKIRCFSAEVDHHFSYIPGLKRNILSLGDSAHEREAILAVTRDMPHQVTKSLKFVERPELEQLRKEHELILGCLRQVTAHDAPLDLCIKWDP